MRWTAPILILFILLAMPVVFSANDGVCNVCPGTNDMIVGYGSSGCTNPHTGPLTGECCASEGFGCKLNFAWYYAGYNKDLADCSGGQPNECNTDAQHDGYCRPIGCTITDSFSYCGDGVLNPFEPDYELCDDGADNEVVCVPPYNQQCSWCTDDCTIVYVPKEDGPAWCGDGVINGPEGEEECDDGPSGSQCCTASCRFATPATTCTGTDNVGLCVAQDYCDGAGSCTDKYQPATTVCRASAGTCDVAEKCDGTTAACPTNTFASSATTCTGSANGGTCDTTDTCAGDSNTCVDKYITAGTPCTGDYNGLECDTTDTCSGSSTCTDNYRSSECRAADGLCDIAESCGGTHTNCPTDTFVAVDTPCRASAGSCDVVDKCDGTTAACPDNKVADGAQGTCSVCTQCDGINNACENIADDTQDSVGTNLCNSNCETCNGAGSCDAQTAGDDLFAQCAARDCSSYIYGWGTSVAEACMAESTTTEGYCVGGSTKACRSTLQECAVQDVEGVQSDAAICGDSECGKSCPNEGAASSYNTVAEVCYTDGAKHGCPALNGCDSTGACVLLSCGSAGLASNGAGIDCSSLSGTTGNYYCSQGFTNQLAAPGYCCPVGQWWDTVGVSCVPTAECRVADLAQYCGPSAETGPFATFIGRPLCIGSTAVGQKPAGMNACCPIPGGKFGSATYYDWTDVSGNNAGVTIY